MRICSALYMIMAILTWLGIWRPGKSGPVILWVLITLICIGQTIIGKTTPLIGLWLVVSGLCVTTVFSLYVKLWKPTRTEVGLYWLVAGFLLLM